MLWGLDALDALPPNGEALLGLCELAVRLCKPPKQVPYQTNSSAFLRASTLAGPPAADRTPPLCRLPVYSSQSPEDTEATIAFGVSNRIAKSREIEQSSIGIAPAWSLAATKRGPAFQLVEQRRTTMKTKTKVKSGGPIWSG
jgi:hypothetical protein